MGCLYSATCLVSGKVYIGITTSSLETRRKMHLKNAREGLPYHLYRALRKHGPDSFAWHVLSEGHSWDDLCRLEKAEIADLKSLGVRLYNMTAGGDGTTGWVCTPEISARISAAQKKRCADPVYREELRARASGVIPSEDTKRKLSVALKGRKKSPETIALMSAAQRGRKRTPQQVEAMAARMRGTPRTAEEKAKISAKMKGVKKSPETVRRMREAQSYRSGGAI